MANFTPQMLRDLLASPDPKDQEFARQLSAMEDAAPFRLGNYPNQPTTGAHQLPQMGPQSVQPVAEPTGYQPLSEAELTAKYGTEDEYRRKLNNAQVAPALTGKYMRGDTGSQKWEAQDTPFTAPVQAAQAPSPELTPNSFRNERTGKVTTLSGGQGQDNLQGEVRVLDQMRQGDGSIFQMIETVTPRGLVRGTRMVMPEEADKWALKRKDIAYKDAQIKAMSPEGIAAEAEAKKIGENEANKKRRALLTPQQRANEDAKAEGVRLEKGEYYDVEKGEVRAREGSNLYIKQNAKYNDDRAGVETAKATAKDVGSKIDLLLLNQNKEKNKNVRSVKNSEQKDYQKEFGNAQSVTKNSPEELII